MASAVYPGSLILANAQSPIPVKQNESNKQKRTKTPVLLFWPVPATPIQVTRKPRPKRSLEKSADVSTESAGSSKSANSATSTPTAKAQGQTRPTLPPLDLPSFQILCNLLRAHIHDDQQRLSDEAIEAFFIVGFRAITKNAYLIPVKPGTKPLPVPPPPAELAPGQSCPVCSDTGCSCPQIIELFKEVNGLIVEKNLVNTLTATRMYKIIRSQMTLRVEQTCLVSFDASHLETLFKWLDSLMPWVDCIYPIKKAATGLSRADELQLRQLLHEVYGNLIVNVLFSIIIEYPESKPILDDLRLCMRVVNLRQILVNKLRSELDRRLLNPGVNTTDVLEAYVSAVKALKYVDPTGILVQLVTPPVRTYLKNRDETVRVILVSLTEESGDLSDELVRNPTCADKKTKIDASNWRDWEPDPIDVPKDKQNLRKSDLIQALISIYGSKTLFIDEYRALLADRLLRMPKPGAITHEIKCLELLKLRFGESDLQKCEVMLKDVSDSHRMNTRFYEEEGAILANQDIDVSGLIVSAQFWPTFKQEALELPENVKKALDNYTKAFEMIKGNRSLEWQRHIGSVDLEIEHGGSVLKFTVTPAQATIIHHFQEKESWTLEELSVATAISVNSLRSRVNFWVSKGILLHPNPDTYCLHNIVNSDNSKTPSERNNRYFDEEDVASPTISISSQRETELQVFWSYIEGMLTNLDSLPLSRIHSMLKLFATVECSLEELQKFLDEKVVQNYLVFSGGQYQLHK